MEAVTISSVYAQSLLEGYVLKGYNPKELLRSLNIPVQIMNNNRLRISTLDFSRLSGQVITTLRDETCGLLNTPLPLGTLETLIRTGFSCSTIADALKQTSRTLNQIASSIQTAPIEDGTSIRIAHVVLPMTGIVGHYALENTMLLCQRIMCWLAGDFIPLERVNLKHPEPRFKQEYQYLYYGAPVYFSQPENSIIFSGEHLGLPVCRDRNDLGNLWTDTQVKLLTQPKRSSSTSVRLRLWMEKVIRSGETPPLLTEAIKHFSTTEQTLRRKLAKEGRSFRQMKEDARRDMAIYFLNSNRYSIEKISEKLAFSESSAFIRAFKQWTGMTPLAYRELQSIKPPPD
ncbi:AraC family transcriptional regulator [Pseudomaricurvus alcaniphilus]|uniref:AraC family transcriptional regulator n=1 Tax=Pseudomaricurvus alcaniphilus TaxID=1166482 RepID=UPI00140BA214|nr:AraC family transcriptional regulator [Pseudomaricurvus alcaniphilus]NHN36514.1 AraC family transcriptional regulator [Pseudomaricurvus alcaniphilus]